jgi:hypothetical protein
MLLGKVTKEFNQRITCASFFDLVQLTKLAEIVTVFSRKRQTAQLFAASTLSGSLGQVPPLSS